LDLHHPGGFRSKMRSPESRRTLTCALSRLTQGPESGTRVTRVSESMKAGTPVLITLSGILDVGCLGCGGSSRCVSDLRFRYVAVFRSEFHTHISVGVPRRALCSVCVLDPELCRHPSPRSSFLAVLVLRSMGFIYMISHSYKSNILYFFVH
jgi:hypothetical protein